jgi:uncharacterized protein with gpF-like domain
MIKYGNLPFDEAITLLRQKLNLPTATWDEIWEAEHMRAFSVAGAMRDDIVADFRDAVSKAIEDGVTIKDFRNDFDNIVAKYGWEYVGGRNWRSRLIYETNIKTMYSAGRWRQMTDPEVVKLRPYMVYRHGDSDNPRPEHLSWDGLVLPADDPWWNTHYPPNGWGCSCFAQTAGPRDLEKMGKDGPDTAPKIEYYDWTNPRTGETRRVPVGIDAGWAYNVGQAADSEVVNV